MSRGHLRRAGGHGARPRWGRRAAAAGLAGLAGLGTAACSGGAGASPGAWDPRVLSIVHFVEKDRGLAFDHPVSVRFLAPAAFQAAVAGGDRTSPSDRKALDEQAAELRALGLAHGHLDLARLESSADQSGTVGFYDSDSKNLYVEGTSMTPYVRVTVAHELTHALQDQRLGLGHLNDLPDDQQPAVSALIEGDAVTVEQDYRNTFSAEEERRYRSEEDALGGGAGGASLPDFLADASNFPYDFGPAFVDSLLNDGGNGRLDGAYRRPPVSEAEVVDPTRYLSGGRPVAVPAPSLPAGAKRLQPPQAYGQLSMAETLGTILGYPAWAAVQGWRGDSSVLYDAGGRTCVAIDTLLGSPAAADTFQAAAATWATRLGGPQVTRQGPMVGIRSCDPGTAAVPPPAVEPAVYDVLAARADLMDNILNGPGETVTQAQCVVDRTVDVLGPAGAVAYDQGDAGAASDGRVKTIEAAANPACGAPK
ncbi:MAG TPA: hypothetical protein VFH45_06695 [Acidimicrobiales bacterium]|nr:hypothetical protein [Acidimicrobiales bacterium]